jgi:hypothetical protein
MALFSGQLSRLPVYPPVRTVRTRWETETAPANLGFAVSSELSPTGICPKAHTNRSLNQQATNLRFHNTPEPNGTRPTMPAPSFSINLADAAKQHLSFLQDAHREGITLSPVTKHSLERYVNIWLRVVVSIYAVLGIVANKQYNAYGI